MKNLKTLLAVGFLTLLTACGTTKPTATADTQTTNNRGRSNTEINATTNSTTNSTTGARQTTRQNTATATAAANAEVANKAKMQKMYTDLNMDDDQINRFESEWNSSEITWKRNNRNKTMNTFERTELQDRIFRDLLNDQQFEQYQQWARENAD
ncbi:hypothetical protein [Aequorivita lipolytica]|uniref:Lipoprotein n=1 Tax=Aequorivita lipolytica TaxID=153267 RepID=A0A5C6YPM2_9FLAO|nr:hypothetical protein [Aequorivita lipolytica]TXD68976.1 hypothetical protein ESV24_09495 [Aequorivita lipolytica]SRX53021.1 hypothetical protein AEQU2_02273 [Aequorivita lipolytica]